MGHAVKRVPLTFDWPPGQVWDGYLAPDKFDEVNCEACTYDAPPDPMDILFPHRRQGTGYSPHGQYLHDLWYGTAQWNPDRGWLPFHPERYGSVLLRPDTPAVRRFAERNIAHSPEFYGGTEHDIRREAQRLAGLFNSMWCHHLNQADVDALVAAGRLIDFTHVRTRDHGWQKIDPPVTPTAAQVNEWSISGGFGHDSLNAMIAVQARCQREGFDAECPHCGGYGSTEAYEGQRAEAEAWEPSGPPLGEGWQLWSTITEGHPVSPVFATSAELAGWMSDPDRGKDWVPADVAARFISHGSAPTGAFLDGMAMSGVEAVGTSPDDGPLGGDNA